MKNFYDLIIIGGGPAGLSAAFTAQKFYLNYLVLEREQIAATIENYPLGKTLFSTVNELEFEPNTLQIVGTKPTREEVLGYYEQFAYQHHLVIHTNENVQDIKAGEPLTVITNQASYQAKTVLVAVGGMGIVNRLNIKGESPERVSYLFREAAPYRDKHVLVVGGGNSAAETMLDLCEAGAQATLILRRASLNRVIGSKDSGIKPWVREPLEAAMQQGRLKILFNAEIVEILPNTAIVAVNKEDKELLCDHIFALIGTQPDISLLIQAGVEIGADERPLYNTESYETNVANLFVAGHLTRELHMKNATQLPPKIVEQIALKIRKNTI